MRAYAVFAGGGVKGAALAGCLSAATGDGLRFIGYGGTSAGSIVALFGAVGMSGKEIRDAFIAEPFSHLLDDRGDLLRKISKTVQATGRLATGKGAGKLLGVWPAVRLFSSFSGNLGLYPGRQLRQFLCETMSNSLSKRKENGDQGVVEVSADEFRRMTFEEFNNRFTPLKVVASDIVTGRPVLFPRDGSDVSVVDAVAASAAYPYVFQTQVIGTRRLLDGGLASNLPSFLFAEESRDTRLTTLAFDLVSNSSENTPNGLLQLTRLVLATSLSASDVLLREVAERVIHVPVEIPGGIGTFDIDLAPNEIENLFDRGFRAAAERLGEHPPLRSLRQKDSNVHRQLIAEYGDADVYAPILRAVVEDVGRQSKATGLRANVMLLTGRGTRMVVYQYGMDADADKTLEIGDASGCSGLAWKAGRPAIADLTVSAKNPEEWDMSADEHGKVPSTQQSMICVPIPGRNGKIVGQPIGTLSVDSKTPLADTSWVDRTQANPAIIEVLTRWATVVARVLP